VLERGLLRRGGLACKHLLLNAENGNVLWTGGGADS